MYIPYTISTKHTKGKVQVHVFDAKHAHYAPSLKLVEQIIRLSLKNIHRKIYSKHKKNPATNSNEMILWNYGFIKPNKTLFITFNDLN